MRLILYLVVLLPVTTVFSAIETWTNLEGQTLEAELIACYGANVSFRRADGSFCSYPIEKLSSDDRQRIQAFIASNSNKNSTTGKSVDNAQSVSSPPPEAKPGQFTQAIEGILVNLNGSRFVPVEKGSLNPIRYYAIYYSAHWCPPCRKFTPELVKAYASLKSQNPDFELIFVSSDQNEKAMKNYMQGEGMPWPAARFDQGTRDATLSIYAERGIPNLVFVSSEGEVLSASYVNGKYVGPRKVLKDIQAKLK